MKRDETAGCTVSDFMQAGKDALGMEVVAGESGLDHMIPEATLNRPGLALAGFFKYFAHRRIQVLGLAEQTYLASLEPEERLGRLRAFFGKRIPCAVITRHRKVLAEIRDLAEEFKVPVLRTGMITKHFINDATIVMANLTAPRKTFQGTMVEIQGIGVLLQGKPGMGKSETALSLISRGYALVSDDVTSMRRDSAGSIIASPVSVTRYHMEIRGLGIIHVPSLFGVASVRASKRLDLIVTLCPADEREEIEICVGGTSVDILGVGIPQVFIPVAPGRDLANVVETAALNEKLKKLGHDAEKELDERLMAQMTSGGVDGSE
ncbi:MAG: HPr(Ser) kinase/phosphatase [Lentisphaerae bacterium]|nr:HPr(Ser) kinase/phosphatase [Lentisphaerota bacterium]